MTIESVLQLPTLVLNKSWQPIDSTTVKESFADVISERALFLEPESYVQHDIRSWMKQPVADGDRFVTTTTGRIKVPEVLLFREYNKSPVRKVHFCRRNLWRRDRCLCFVPETLILMADGNLRRIDSIEEDDKILDSEGNVQTVEFVHSAHTTEDLIVLRHRGNGDYLSCTADHKVLVSDKEFNTRWVQAKDITTDDYLCELDIHKRITQESDKLDLSAICHSLKHLKSELEGSDAVVRDYNRKSIRRHISVNEQLGRLVGYFLAEGHIYKNTVIFTFHLDEDNFATEVQNLIRIVFATNSSCKKSPAQTTQRVICCSSIVAEFLRKWCFHNSEKRVCSKNVPLPYLRGILYGILRGDGSFNETQFRATLMMKTENLVRDVYLISHICGIKATLSKTGHREDGRIYKSVIYNAQEFNKIVEICGLQKTRYMNTGKIDRLFNGGTRFISKVTSISRMSYGGLVYNLQISGTHTYVADFVCVHNCQYCGKEPPHDDISVDHIVPLIQGGKTSFPNCVLACTKCNRKKGGRTPEQAGMRLQRRKRLKTGEWITEYYETPKVPVWNPLYGLRRKHFPKSWAAFLRHFDETLYWEVSLGRG